MTTSVTGKLSGDTWETSAGNFTIFNFRVGVKFWDHATQQNQWTNYKVALFVQNSQDRKLELYRQVLIKGTLVEVAATQEKACIGKAEGGANYGYIELLKPQLVNFWVMKEKVEKPEQQEG